MLRQSTSPDPADLCSASSAQTCVRSRANEPTRYGVDATTAGNVAKGGSGGRSSPAWKIGFAGGQGMGRCGRWGRCARGVLAGARAAVESRERQLVLGRGLKVWVAVSRG